MPVQKKVLLNDISVFPNSVPLGLANLKAYALKDEFIRNHFDISIRSQSIQETNAETLLKELLETKSDIYGLNCYVWNFKLVKKLTMEILRFQPDAKVIWGGPQVAGRAESVLPGDTEGLFVCNSIGETTFYNFLLEASEVNPDFEKVNGLSFRGDQQIVTTENGPPLQNLDEIPSPFLMGLIPEDTYTYSIYETNRGCPYNCAFCYWAGIKGKILKYSEERVYADLEWLCKNNMYVIQFADANWGIFDRDVEFTEFIGKCKEKYDFPFAINMSTELRNFKNRMEIARIIKKYELSSTISFSLQSLNPECLKYINRRNIKQEEIQDLMDKYNEMELSTYIELVWPLPGETLQSFNAGIDTMLKADSDFIVIYPCLLLPSTELYRRRDEYKLSTQSADDGIGVKDIIVSTAWVTKEEYIQGLFQILCNHILFNCRTLYGFMHFLARNNIMIYSELYIAFYNFMKAENYNAYTLYQNAVDDMSHSDFTKLGVIAYKVLKEERGVFERFLGDFVTTHNMLQSDDAKLVFELDLFNKPYLYLTDTLQIPDYDFVMLKDIELADNRFSFSVDSKYKALIRNFTEKNEITETAAGRVIVRHDEENKLPFTPNMDYDHIGDYCYALIMHIRDILPTWMSG